MATREFRPSSGRFGGKGLAGPVLTEGELRMLARVSYAGHVIDRGESPEDPALLLSLERFHLIDYAHMYENGRWVNWAWIPNDAGREFLARLRPLWHGCRCGHAIRLQCVCTERTFCPNPNHAGNGCHGSHD